MRGRAALQTQRRDAARLGRRAGNDATRRVEVEILQYSTVQYKAVECSEERDARLIDSATREIWLLLFLIVLGALRVSFHAIDCTLSGHSSSESEQQGPPPHYLISYTLYYITLLSYCIMCTIQFITEFRLNNSYYSSLYSMAPTLCCTV